MAYTNQGVTVDFVPVLAIPLLIIKLIDFMRYARAGDFNGVFTQLIAWVASIAVLFLVAHTDSHWSDAIVIGSVSIAKLSGWSLVFYGLGLGSGASVAKDALKAVDQHQSAAIPTLVPSNVAGTDGG